MNDEKTEPSAAWEQEAPGAASGLGAPCSPGRPPSDGAGRCHVVRRRGVMMTCPPLSQPLPADCSACSHTCAQKVHATCTHSACPYPRDLEASCLRGRRQRPVRAPPVPRRGGASPGSPHRRRLTGGSLCSGLGSAEIIVRERSHRWPRICRARGRRRRRLSSHNRCRWARRRPENEDSEAGLARMEQGPAPKGSDLIGGLRAPQRVRASGAHFVVSRTPR